MQETMSQADVRKLLTGGYVGPRPAPYALESIEIELPIPPESTHPNSRGAHWSKKASGVKKQRADAADMAAIVLRLKRAGPPRWKAATIQATFHRPGKRSQLMDADNLIAWCKGSIDGLQDAGVLDNDRNVTWLPPLQVLGDAAEERKLVLVLTHEAARA